jgi:hypothetical protein
VRRRAQRRQRVERGPPDGRGLPLQGERVVVAEAAELVGEEGRGRARGVDAGEDLRWGRWVGQVDGGWWVGGRDEREKEGEETSVVVVAVGKGKKNGSLSPTLESRTGNCAA